jgi:hypothetical protein
MVVGQSPAEMPNVARLSFFWVPIPRNLKGNGYDSQNDIFEGIPVTLVTD